MTWIDLAVSLSLHKDACIAVWLDVDIGEDAAQHPVSSDIQVNRLHSHAACSETFLTFVLGCRQAPSYGPCTYYESSTNSLTMLPLSSHRHARRNETHARRFVYPLVLASVVLPQLQQP